MKSYEFFELVLEGRTPAPEDLDALLAHNPREDQWVDWKDSLVLRDPKKAASVLRSYVSGFANAMGGVLLVGVEDGTRKITGCPPIGKASPAEWATNVLAPVAPHLSPPPTILEIPHGSGSVLGVAVGRSQTLVPILESGRISYAIRVGDVTIPMPDFLAADLLSGRRAQPDLVLDDPRPVFNSDPPLVGLLFRVRNDSFTAAEAPAIGLIYEGLAVPGYGGSIEMGSYLRAWIDAPPKHVWQYHAQVPVRGENVLVGFQASEETHVAARLRNPNGISARMAVYVIARNATPKWYALEIAATRTAVTVCVMSRAHGRIRVSTDYSR